MQENSQASNRFTNSKTVDLLHLIIIGVTVLTLLIALTGGAMWLWILTLVAGLLIGYWVMKLEESTTSSVEKLRQLRKLVLLRKNHQQEATAGGVPHPAFFAIGSLIVVAFLGSNLARSWQQFNAHSLPSTMGTITRYENEDIGLVESQLEIDYQYTVDGQAYDGHMFRFANRPYRVETEPAKQLAANWKVGNRVPVFYKPDAPQHAVVDNTFCKGDELYIGLNACALLLALIVGTVGTLWPFIWRERFHSLDSAANVDTIRLSNVPLWGTAGLILSGFVLLITFCCYVGGLMAMGLGEIKWLVVTIDLMVPVTLSIALIALVVAGLERLSYGSGRTLEVDTGLKKLNFRPEGFANTQSVDLRNLEAIRVVSNRDDFFRMGRTFSVVVVHRDDANTLRRAVLQRSYGRKAAVNLVYDMKQILFARAANAWTGS